MRIINKTPETIPRLEEIIEFVKPKSKHLPTRKFDFMIDYQRGNTSHAGFFYNNTYKRPRIKLLIKRPENRSKVYPIFRKFMKWVRIRIYYDEIDEETGKISETYYHWRFPINKPLKQNGLTRILAVNNSEKGVKLTGYLDTLVLSEEEWNVNVIAHEFRHFWQSNHPGKRGRVWGARGRYSEMDADAYAIKMMRKWRKERGPKDILSFEGMNWELLETTK